MRALVEKVARPPVDREPVIEVVYEVENSPFTWRIPGPKRKFEPKVPSAASRTFFVPCGKGTGPPPRR